MYEGHIEIFSIVFHKYGDFYKNLNKKKPFLDYYLKLLNKQIKRSVFGIKLIKIPFFEFTYGLINSKNSHQSDTKIQEN